MFRSSWGKEENLVSGMKIIFLVGNVENTWNSTDLTELQNEAEIYNDILQVENLRTQKLDSDLIH